MFVFVGQNGLFQCCSYIIMAVQCFIDWLCYVGVYVTVFSILCSLSSFFPICLVAIIFWWIKVYINYHRKRFRHFASFIYDLSVDDATMNTPIKRQFIFIWLVLATVHHLFTNFEMFSLNYIGPFWRTDSQTDRTTEDPTSVMVQNSCNQGRG